MRPWPLAALVLVGCRGTSSSPVRHYPPAKPDADRVVLTDPTEKTPAVLWNGRFGVQIGRSGLGENLPAFWENSYQKDKEEKILPVENPFPARLLLEGRPLDPSAGTDYEQALDLHTGVLTTSWQANGSKITVKTSIDPVNLSGEWSAESDPPLALSVTQMRSGGLVQGMSQISGSGKAKGSFTGAEPSPPVSTASSPSDIAIDGPVEDQQNVRAALFYLRTSVSPQGKMGVAPMGLSSDVYNGHVFWDADIWVFPALALLEPERAGAIARYRLARLTQARQNYVEWAKGGRKTGSAPLGPANPVPNAVKYPWESSVTGRETTPTNSQFEDHITGDVAFMLRQAAALGIAPSRDTESVLNGAAEFYADRSVAGPSGSEIKGTMSPDENHIGDNDLYTNLLAQWCLAGGRHPAKPTFKLPRQGETFLTYDNDALRGYKQAAAVLAIYPLQYPPAEAEAKAMLARFEDKVTKNGPAMTDAIQAIVHARMGDPEGAYKIWRQDWRDFGKTGLLLFSEKRNRPRTYFTTGAGGMLQAVLYGFCGLRLDTHAAPGAVWQMALRDGYILSCRPNLPKAWKGVTLKGLRVNGKAMEMRIEPGKVTVK